MTTERTFPIMDKEIKSLPWEMVAPHEAQAFKNHYQTLDKLAHRCGLSPCEALALLEDRHYRHMDKDRARLLLREKLAVFTVRDAQ